MKFGPKETKELNQYLRTGRKKIEIAPENFFELVKIWF